MSGLESHVLVHFVYYSSYNDADIPKCIVQCRLNYGRLSALSDQTYAYICVIGAQVLVSIST